MAEQTRLDVPLPGLSPGLSRFPPLCHGLLTVARYQDLPDWRSTGETPPASRSSQAGTLAGCYGGLYDGLSTKVALRVRSVTRLLLAV